MLGFAIKPAAVIFLIFAFSTLAHADWQYTKWGQPLADLLKLDNVKPLTGKQSADNSIEVIGRALAQTVYQSKEFVFDTTFLFRDEGLSGVYLKFKSSSDAYKAWNRLKAQYGEPFDFIDRFQKDCRDLRGQWRDADRGNNVVFQSRECVDGLFYASVVYTPIIKASESGL